MGTRKTPGFGDVANPFGEVDVDVEDRYIPPSTGLGAWERQQPPIATQSAIIEDDEPFTAAHLAAASQGAVPSITRPSGPPLPLPTLNFTTSVGVSRDMSGKIDRPSVPSVPRVGAAPEATRLLPPGATSSSTGGGGGGPSSGNISSPPHLPIEDPSSYAIYNIKRYRTYFNIDTDEVLARIFRAVALFFKGDFFDHIGGNPDLYGPFWIASTLVFVSAAGGGGGGGHCACSACWGSSNRVVLRCR